MAKVLFAAPQVGMMLLPLMIFHQFQLMVCAVLDIDLVECLGGAYNEIKDRKGYLTPEGIFVKEV